jgi:transposase InsO family protein
MSYSSNPLLPKARKWAINLVLVDHLSVSQAARRAAVHRTTLWRWLKRWQQLELHGNSYLPTRSSRPHTFGHSVAPRVVERIQYFRTRYRRCAEIVHAHCIAEGTVVSLSTVRRVLRRLGLVARKRYHKAYRAPVPRPVADAPGKLVQTDTVHLTSTFHGNQRTYLYTAVDVYSRWAYAEYHPRISQELSTQFLSRAEAYAGFHFSTVQADNGAEFGKWFEDTLRANGTAVRHSRVRRPNDNAYIERFNRTIQEECVRSTNPFSEELYSKVLDWLAYYNEERLHLGLQCRTPASMLQRC